MSDITNQNNNNTQISMPMYPGRINNSWQLIKFLSVKFNQTYHVF